jgi:hypothetical protein
MVLQIIVGDFAKTTRQAPDVRQHLFAV